MTITQGTQQVGIGSDGLRPSINFLSIRESVDKVYSITLFGAAIPSVDGTYAWNGINTLYNRRIYYKGLNFIYWDPNQGGAWALIDIPTDGMAYASKKLISDWAPGLDGYPPNPIVTNITYS